MIKPKKSAVKEPAVQESKVPAKKKASAYVIAIANQKGGVAKTTTCINLSAGLVAAKRRVLVVDIDPQGNTTMGSGLEPPDISPTIYEVLMGKKTAEETIIKQTQALYDLLPANRDLTAAEVKLQKIKDKQYCLKNALAPLMKQYDYIFIDCPPALNVLTVNAMAVADGLLVPIQCEYFALRGLADLNRTVEGINSTVNPKLKIEGIIRTMFDKRNRLANEVSNQLLEVFGDRVYNVIIPRNVRLAEAPGYGLPIVSYDKNSSGSITYLALAGEFIRRHEDE